MKHGDTEGENKNGFKLQTDENSAYGGRHDDGLSDHSVHKEKLLSRPQKVDLSTEESSLDITKTVGLVQLEDSYR